MKMILAEIPHEKGHIACVPVCHKCGEIIWDLDKANVCPSTPATMLGFPAEVEAFHWDCEPRRSYPWKRLSEVIQLDQRMTLPNGDKSDMW